MANHDHRDNIGTHPAYSQDPETRMRARVEAAQRILDRAQRNLRDAQANLDAFLIRKEAVQEADWFQKEAAR